MEKSNSGLIWLVIFVAIYFGYQWAVVNPRNKLEAEKKERSDVQINLNWCLDQADKDYNALWESNGTKHSDGLYYVTNSIRDWLEEKRKNDRESCFKQYPQN